MSEWAQKIRGGDLRALARAASGLENRDPAAMALLREMVAARQTETPRQMDARHGHEVSVVIAIELPHELHVLIEIRVQIARGHDLAQRLPDVHRRAVGLGVVLLITFSARKSYGDGREALRQAGGQLVDFGEAFFVDDGVDRQRS